MRMVFVVVMSLVMGLLGSVADAAQRGRGVGRVFSSQCFGGRCATQEQVLEYDSVPVVQYSAPVAASNNQDVLNFTIPSGGLPVSSTEATYVTAVTAVQEYQEPTPVVTRQYFQGPGKRVAQRIRSRCGRR